MCAYILTAQMGNNAELFAKILKLYLPDGGAIADVTYGKGIFWTDLCEWGHFELHREDKFFFIDDWEIYPSDIQPKFDYVKQMDARNLDYQDGSFNCVVLDPPYMHSDKGGTIKNSISQVYNNNQTGNFTSVEEIEQFYLDASKEAHRILKIKGLLIVKCMDQICSGKQHMTHANLLIEIPKLGFIVEDLFVLVQKGCPTKRYLYQKHARKNHSYFLVFRKKP